MELDGKHIDFVADFRIVTFKIDWMRLHNLRLIRLANELYYFKVSQHNQHRR